MPVERVSWEKAREFCDRLSRLDAASYRLPTEAEWEYACRGGTTGPYAGSVELMGWYYANSTGTTHPVGQKQPNGFGLYDMHGNVGEWCLDWYKNAYPDSTNRGNPPIDPVGPASGSHRVRRGGSWYYSAINLRSACRSSFAPDDRHNTLGFRIVRTSE